MRNKSPCSRGGNPVDKLFQTLKKPIPARLEMPIAIEAEGHPHHPTQNLILRYESEIAGIGAVIAIVAHDEIMPLGNGDMLQFHRFSHVNLQYY